MKKSTPSLRRQMAWIILLCWLLPMVIAATGVGWYLLSGSGRQKEQAMAEQFQMNLQLGADRVNSAVEASRLPSYDPEFREGWNQYRQDGVYNLLYRRSYALFNRLYQSDSRFLYGVFCFADDPEDRVITVVNGSAGLFHNQVREQWTADSEAVLELAAGLDTTVGFLEREGRVYLVRNMMDSSYRPIGVLAPALDPDYFFGDLALLSWASAVSVRLEPEVTLTLKGEAPPQPGGGRWSIPSGAGIIPSGGRRRWTTPLCSPGRRATVAAAGHGAVLAAAAVHLPVFPPEDIPARPDVDGGGGPHPPGGAGLPDRHRDGQPGVPIPHRLL